MADCRFEKRLLKLGYEELLQFLTKQFIFEIGDVLDTENMLAELTRQKPTLERKMQVLGFKYSRSRKIIDDYWANIHKD